MTISHLLEDFAGASDEVEKQDSVDEAIEVSRLDAFEKGYQAGWDDSKKAHKQELTNLSAEFSQNLQDFSFTYHEAFLHLTHAIEPLLQTILEKILPEIAHKALIPKVLAEIKSLTTHLSEPHVCATLNRANGERLQHLIAADQAVTITIDIDENLNDSQVVFKISDCEYSFDIDLTLSQIKQLVSNYFSPQAGAIP